MITPKTVADAARDLARRITRDANTLYPDADVTVLVATDNEVTVIMCTDILRIRPSRDDAGLVRGWEWTALRAEGDGAQEPYSLETTATGRISAPQIDAALDRATTFMAWTDHESRA